MAGLVEIVVHTSGDTRRLTYTAKDLQGAAVDITGASIRWGLFKLDPDISDPTAKNTTTILPGGTLKSVGSGITITDAVNGVFRIDVDPADTAALKGGDYYQESEIVTVAADVATALYGIFRIKKDGIV